MRGVITNRIVWTQAVTIVREFGLGAYARCLRAAVTGRPATFLEAVCPLASARPSRSRRVTWPAFAAAAAFIASLSPATGRPRHGPELTCCTCEASIHA